MNHRVQGDPRRASPVREARRFIGAACRCGGDYVLEQFEILAHGTDSDEILRKMPTHVHPPAPRDYPLQVDIYHCRNAPSGVDHGIRVNGCGARLVRILSVKGETVYKFGTSYRRIW